MIFSAIHSKEEWRKRSVYQLLTDRFGTSDGSEPWCDVSQNRYCGGTYQGIINHLDYIKGMGFDAIWISPHVDNWPNSYHGYHFRDWYKTNDNFGSKEDLHRLIKEAHAKGIWVMADIIANHVAPVNSDFSQINPFNKAEHYHDYCVITDYNNQEMVENCRFVGDIPDLKQENDWVTNELIKWIQWTVKEFDFDGLRIDTVKHVPKWFWKKFVSATYPMFQIGEVFDGRIEYTADYQRYMDSVFNYPLYYAAKDGFCSKNFQSMKSWFYESRKKFPDPGLLGTIVENHDNARMLSGDYCNNRVTRENLKSALIFTILFEGIPFIYYGGEQYFSGGNDPYDREPMWGHYNTQSDSYIAIAKANEIRRKYELWSKDCVERYISEQFLAFTRGNDVLVCISNSPVTITLYPKIWNDGTKVCDALNPSDCQTVTGGTITVNMNGHPKVYVKP
jgi:alpha-amylase